MERPVIALLSDFGTQDHYAGAMKGVALGICPDVILVDITHDIPPHDVRTGALELAATYQYFPAGTVFLVVVDPEVGLRLKPRSFYALPVLDQVYLSCPCVYRAGSEQVHRGLEKQPGRCVQTV